MTALETLLQQTNELSVEEQRHLLAHLTERLRQQYAGAAPQTHPWSSLRGRATYPFFGEDAQGWVSRSRQESERTLEQPR